MSEENIDQIVEQTENSTNQEIPMEQQAPSEEQLAPQAQEYEFQYEDRQIKAPVDKILKWASMGYGAPQKIGELSRKISEYEPKIKQFQEFDSKYRPIDDWAKQNPDKWKTLIQSWQQSVYGSGQQQEQGQKVTSQLPPEVLQKLQEHDQRWQKQDEEVKVQKERQADQYLSREIDSIRKSYSNLDFDAPDESGNSLEFRILEHATKNGIPSFRAAFRDYCFDKLSQSSEARGRAASQLPSQTKAALLGKNPAATRGRATPDLKGMNYDQIHEMILSRELGVTG